MDWSPDRFGRVEVPPFMIERLRAAGWSADQSTSERHGMSGPPGRDLFVSYRSHDVMSVRPVVEKLLAGGVSTWFAENEILLDNYDAFRTEIDHGIGAARFGLCFTSFEYEGSEHCEYELEHLLRRMGAGRRRVLQVIIVRDGSRRYPGHPKLESHGTLIWHGDPADLISWLGEKTSLDVSRCYEPPPELGEATRLVSSRPRVAFDTTGYRLARQRMVPFCAEETWLDGSAMGRELVAHLEFPPVGHGDDRRELSSLEPELDDVLIAARQRAHALAFLRRGAVETGGLVLLGVHLFFHRGLGQFAMTYVESDLILRKYALLLDDPRAGRIEVVVTGGTPDNVFDFYRVAPHLDRLVSSARANASGKSTIHRGSRQLNVEGLAGMFVGALLAALVLLWFQCA